MRHTYETQYDGHHLRIRRRDGRPVLTSWSVLQRIKDDIAGSATAFVEVYPAADSVVDEANYRHFWRVSEEDLEQLGATLGSRRKS